MIKRYKEILFGFMLGLAMWVADALMHTMMLGPTQDHQPAFAEELFAPHGPQLITRLLFVAFALFFGWLLWRSNQREREVRDLERRLAHFYEQTITPATLIMDECNTLLRSGGLTGESLELIREIRTHARQIDDFVKDFPRRLYASSRGSDAATAPSEASPPEVHQLQKKGGAP